MIHYTTKTGIKVYCFSSDLEHLEYLIKLNLTEPELVVGNYLYYKNMQIIININRYDNILDVLNLPECYYVIDDDIKIYSDQVGSYYIRYDSQVVYLSSADGEFKLAETEKFMERVNYFTNNGKEIYSAQDIYDIEKTNDNNCKIIIREGANPVGYV